MHRLLIAKQIKHQLIVCHYMEIPPINCELHPVNMYIFPTNVSVSWIDCLILYSHFPILEDLFPWLLSLSRTNEGGGDVNSPYHWSML